MSIFTFYFFKMQASTEHIIETSRFISGYASINGIRMYYEIHGEGNIPLVLIHGGGSTIESTFGNLVPSLRDYGKLIAVELQAHGRTSDRNAAESFEQDADDVVALMDHLRIDKANFAGFSNGGTTTLQIAIRHSEKVNKIIIISGAFKRDGFIPGFFENMHNATLENMPAPLKELYLKVNPDKNGLDVMFKKDRQRMIGFQDIPEKDILSIQCPTLIIAGDQDVTTSEHALLISKMITGSRLLILPGSHGSFIGESCSVQVGSKIPEAAAVVIKEFLEE
jgi:pimeloyl-ACP methyl ester carboxylesterase